MGNLSAASLTQIGLLIVLICWTTGSTSAAISFEEEIVKLKENYIQMKQIVKNLESKVSELESKDVQMQKKDAKMQEKVTELEAKVKQQDSLLISLLREKKEDKTSVDFDFASINKSAVAINGLPSSCADLKMVGHIWSGFYSVMGSTMMESVYCDFTKLPGDAGFQKWIGYADVKSAPIHFYVQRNSPFSTTLTPIPFDLALVNEGNAMNLATGIFTAPRTGIYFFSFTGQAFFPSSTSRVWLGVNLYLNNGLIGTGYASEANTVSGQSSTLTLQSTLNLKSGDKVWMMITDRSSGEYLWDTTRHYTHFTGFMLEEEIVASL